jgi:hypothetical protein
MGGKQQEGEYAGSGIQITAVIKVVEWLRNALAEDTRKCMLVEAMANLQKSKLRFFAEILIGYGV